MKNELHELASGFPRETKLHEKKQISADPLHHQMSTKKTAEQNFE